MSLVCPSEIRHPVCGVGSLVLERHTPRNCSQFLEVSRLAAEAKSMAKLMFNLLRAGFTCCVPCWPPARHVCVGNITSTSYQLDLLQHLAKNLPSSMPVPVQKIQCTKLLRPRSTTKHSGSLCWRWLLPCARVGLAGAYSSVDAISQVCCCSLPSLWESPPFATSTWPRHGRAATTSSEL